MMIRSLRQLLKAYWKEQTKAQIKQQESRLLIYDEHLKRFVCADELLIPNESFKVNKVGGAITKRKSKNLLYDLLLKKFVNTKLDVFSHGGKDDRPFCKINSLQQKYENISTSNRDFFWGKRDSGKKQRVPALPPVDKKPLTKEDETTNTGWAGQRTIDPETDPRPELRTSSDCPLGPGKRPDKKRQHKKNNTGKRLIVCAKENYKIAEKEPSASIGKVSQSKTKISVASTISKPKDQVQHSKVSVIKSQDCIYKEDNTLKSRVILSEKNPSHLSEGHTNPCLHKTGETVTPIKLQSDDVSNGKSIEKLKCNKSKIVDGVQTQKPSTKGKCINNSLKTTVIGLNCETTGQIKEQSGITSDRAMTKHKSSKMCASRNNHTGLKFSYNKDVNENNKISGRDTNEQQNSKVNQAVSSQNLEKQDVTNSVTKCDFSYNKDVNKIITFREGITTELGNNSKINKPLTNQNAQKQTLSKHVANIVAKCGSNCKDENHTICPSFESKWDQDRKRNEPGSDKKVCKPFGKEVPQKIMRCTSDSNVNFNFSVNPNGGKFEQCFRSSEPTNKINSSETNASSSGQKCTSSAQGNTDDYSPKSTCMECKSIKVESKPLNEPSCLRQPDVSNSITVKNEPLKSSCLRQPDLSNNDNCSCKEESKFSKIELKKGLEFGMKRSQEPTTVCCVENKNPNDQTKNELIQSKGADTTFSPKPCLSINTIKHCGIDSKVNENLEAITKDKCLNELSHDNELSKMTGKCYLVFKIKNSLTGISDLNECKNKRLESNPKELQAEECKKTSREGKIKKSKHTIFKGDKKCKKSCSKDVKSSLKEKCLGKEDKQEMRCEQEHSYDTQIENCMSNMSQEERVAKRNKHKLETIKTLSSNMSARHSKEILKKCKPRINLKSNTKDNKTPSAILSHAETKERELLSEHEGLENKIEFNLKEEDQLLKNNQISSSKNNPITKNIHDPVTVKQPSQGRLKQTESTLTAKICSKRYPSNKKSEILLKPIQKKENKPVIVHKCKVRFKGISNNLVRKIKSPRKCNICSVKNVSNQSSNKLISQANVSDNFKSTRNGMNNTPNSKATSLASQKVKKQEISYFSGLNLLSHELKTLSIKASSKKLSKSNTSKSERPSYKKRKNYTLPPQTMEENRVLVNESKHTNNNKSCKGDNERNTLKTPLFASLPTSKTGFPLHSSAVKSSCNTDEIKEPNIVSIKAYTDSHDLPGKNASNQSSNKQIQKANVSDNCYEATTNVTKNASNSTASQKLNKQEIRHFGGLNFHRGEFKSLSVKANPEKLSQCNASKSERGSYKTRKNDTLRPKTMEDNTVLVNVSNQTYNKKGCNSDDYRNTQQTSLLASLPTSKKGVPLRSSIVKSSCSNVKVIEQNIVPIRAYVDSHELPHDFETHLFNSNVNNLKIFTKYTTGTPIPKKKKGSQSIIVKPLLVKNMVKNNPSTIVDMGNVVVTTFKREGINKMCKENLSMSESNKVTSNTAETKNPKNAGSNHIGGIVNKINIPTSNEANQIMINKNLKVGFYNNNNQTKKSNSLLDRVRNKAEDKISLEKVEIASRNHQEKHHAGIMGSVKIENRETDKNLIKLAKKHPLIRNKTIENDISPFVSKVRSDDISQASTLPPKCNITKTNTVLPRKPPNVKELLKDNISFKATHQIQDLLQKGIDRDSNNTKISNAQSISCPNKGIKRTAIRGQFAGHKIPKSSVLKSSTFTALSSRRPKANILKTKTFAIQTSKMDKTNVLKTKTFTVISSRSSKEGKQRVTCTIKKP